MGVTMTISTGIQSTKERESTTHKYGVEGKDVLDNKGVKSVKIVAMILSVGWRSPTEGTPPTADDYN